MHAYDNYALCYASRKENTVVVKLLLTYGADVHAHMIIETYRDYSLCMASEKGYTGIVRFLLFYGADVNANEDYPFRWASRNKHIGTVKVLQDYL